MHPVGSEDIFKHISRDKLPVEVGGTGKSHSHFQGKLYKYIIKNKVAIFFRNNYIYFV